MATIITGDAIDNFRLRVMLSALKLEVAGMHKRGAPVSVMIRKILTDNGIKAAKNKQTLLFQFSNFIAEQGNN